MSDTWTPRKYQELAIKFLLERTHAGLLLDPGLGKTSIALAAFKILKRQRLHRAALVVAPRRPCTLVWPAERRRWENFLDLDLVVLRGAHRDKLLEEQHDVYCINPEGLGWLVSKLRGRRQLPFDLLIVDESTKFKNTRTDRFANLQVLLPKMRRRWILTGTPAPNSLEDLFGQCYVMDMGKSFGPYITQFRSEYFYKLMVEDSKGKEHPVYVPKEHSEERIYRVLEDRALRLDARDHLDMPELLERFIEVELPPKARTVYDQLEKDFFVRMAAGEINALNAGTLSGKLRQVASGGVFLSDSEEGSWQLLHDEKTDAVEELLEELSGQPLLVAYMYRHDLERLRKRFGERVPVLGGGVSDKRAAQLEREWNEGRYPLMLGHPQSIGHGLNLQRGGHHVAWYTLTNSYEDFDQMNRRLYRQGQPSRFVHQHYLLARDTVDYGVFHRVLSGKRKRQDSLLVALREYGMQRYPSLFKKA